MSCNRCKKTPCGCVGKQVIFDPCPVGVNEIMTDPTATAQSAPDCDPNADSSNKLYITNFATFNMPACGEYADVIVSEADRVAFGSALHAPGVGYLEVIAILDEVTLRLKNNCPTCGGEALNGKEPGQAVAAETNFIVGIPFCSFAGGSVSGGGPYLDADFTIPASGQCALAKATNVQGLSIGDIVAIDSKQYRIGAIPDATTLQLCNDGDGGTANSVIDSDPDNDGSPNFPIIRLQGQNPCTTTAVNEVSRLVGCNGSDQQVGLVGTVVGHTPGWEGTKWGLRVLPKERACAVLVTELTLDPDAPFNQTYIVEVDNIDPILELLPPAASNDLLRLVLGDDQDLWLDSVVSGNTIRVQSAHTVGVIEHYPIGTILCAEEYSNQCHPNILVQGPFNGSKVPKEFSVVIDNGAGVPIDIVIPANSVLVTTLPNSIGSAGIGLGGGQGLWGLTYDEGQFACDKYILIKTNFEATIIMPDGGVAANVEFRIVKMLPSFDTQAGAAATFYGGFPLISPAISPNLLIGGNGGAFYGVNTFKGNLEERDYHVKGQLNQWQGHVRIVAQNTTGGPKTISFAGLWRGRREAHGYIVL